MKRITWKTRHLVAGVEITGAVSDLEIVEKDGAFFLLRFDRAGACVADTWHATEAEAQAQAKFEYEVEPEDWKSH